MRTTRATALLLVLGAAMVSAAFVACGGADGTDPVGPGGSEGGTDGPSPLDSPAGDAPPSGSYTVGGNVTGLGAPDGGVSDAGDGGLQKLALRNSGGDDLEVASNGPFTFSKKVVSGAPYAVTVKTQPTGLTCAVASGSGTMGGANVTNVGVSCGRSQHTIFADVKGLITPGLVLQQNGGNDITVNATTKVQFNTKVGFGDAYDVTIKTQPPGRPKQVCSIDAGSGSALGDVTVTVNCVNDFLLLDAYDADVTFDSTVLNSIIGMIWNGTAYYETTSAGALNTFDNVFAPVQTYQLSDVRVLRGVFAVGPQIYVRAVSSAAVEKVSATGVLSAGVTLVPTPLCSDCPVVYNAPGAQLLARYKGTVQKWKLSDGTALASTTLIGWGADPNEDINFYNQWSAAASGYLFTFASGVLSVWNPATGVRVKSVTLNGADPTAATLGLTLSYANGHIWVRDLFNGTATWRGYDVGL